MFAAVAFERQQQFDVVVYGGTAGGVITAVSAAREGLKIALLEPGQSPRRHGVRRTRLDRFRQEGSDRRNGARVLLCGSGATTRCSATVRKSPGCTSRTLPKTPSARCCKEAGVTVFEHHRLREKTGVRKEGASVREITMENGASFHREYLRRQHLRRRSDGAERRHLHVGTRRRRAIWRITGGRSREDAAAPVHWWTSRQATRTANCCPKSRLRSRDLPARRQEGPGVQLPHVLFGRSGECQVAFRSPPDTIRSAMRCWRACSKCEPRSKARRPTCARC